MATQHSTNPRIKNRAGIRYGRLLAVSLAECRKTANGSATFWNCACDCGAEVVVRGSQLGNGKTKSCGCLVTAVTTARNTTHSMAGTRPYRIWANMKSRCTNKKTDGYPRYGGRGVTVCKRWLNSFEAFLEDMGEPPTQLHSIDRYPDQCGNYEPGNCRWATPMEQGSNMRNNRMMTFEGQTMTLSNWSRKLKVSLQTLHHRLRAGWTDEEALATPIRKQRCRTN